MDVKEKILQIIRIRGPIVPADISGEIEANLLLTSAYLSELVSQKRLKMTNLKVGGGSPLYYAPGQESRIQEFSKHLNEKNRQAFDYLKENRVLRDSEMTPLMRVAMREIKDFSRPLEVIFNDKKEIFWKWYLMDNNEAGVIIKQKLGIEKPKVEVEEEKPGILKKLVTFGKKKEEEEVKKDFEEEESKDFEKLVDEEEPEPPKEEPESPKPVEKSIEPEPKPEPKEDKQEQLDDNLAAWKDTESGFITTLKDYFQKKDIEIIEADIKRKDSDIEFIIKIDSSIGRLTYFCKAKNKKKINDGDLSSVFIEGQMKKLPVMLIITGDMTKKAENMLQNELKGIAVLKID